MKLVQLQKIFENATEEQLQQVNSFYQKDKDIIKNLQEENNTLSTQVTELKNDISELEKNKGNSEELQKNINELQEKLKMQEETYKKETEERKINDLINEVISTKKWTNEATKLYYTQQLKEELTNKENVGKSAEELLTAMTKDVDNVYINEQQEKIEIPAVGNTGNNVAFTAKQLETMSSDDINKNWDNIVKGVTE